MATSHDKNLYVREPEMDLILDSLNKNQITILSGKPGVGKTKLALECIKQYGENRPEYEIKCLRNNGQNLYEDLKLTL